MALCTIIICTGLAVVETSFNSISGGEKEIRILSVNKQQDKLYHISFMNGSYVLDLKYLDNDLQKLKHSTSKVFQNYIETIKMFMPPY